jgi:3-polyprenyl-4-hydroxybenzoate decarboxylase
MEKEYVDIKKTEDDECYIEKSVQPHSDLVIIEGALTSPLDPSADEGEESRKWGIDATVPVGVNRERYIRILTRRRASSPDAE